MRVAVSLSALMLAACGQAETPVAPAVVETPAPTMVGGVDLSQPLRAIGTEPFWGVEITPDIAERCYEEYRALRRRLDKDMKGYEPGRLEPIEPGDLGDDSDKV